jgi:single-stranded-DNA-specific exonuclease
MYDDWLDGPLVTTTLFEHITTQRAITDPAAFLNLSWPESMHDPFLMNDMDKVVARFQKALEQGEKIGIVGDYDMDGTPGAALLSDFLTRCGTTPMVIIPTREEGYGFAPAFVDRAEKAGVSLIITIDCGIRDSEAVEKANAQHIDVIITDHRGIAAGICCH